jgi:hypothetical protein
VTGLSRDGSAIWRVMYAHSANSLAFRCGDIHSTTPLDGAPVEGRHPLMIMARGAALKA